MGKLESVTIIYSDIYTKHSPPNDHPENPDRIRRIIKSIRESDVKINMMPPKEISSLNNYIEKVHSRSYVEYIKKISYRGHRIYIDPDTYIDKDTYRVASTAFNGSVSMIDLIASENHRVIIHILRPPGHHAGRYGKAMGASTQGFCIFNNIAGSAIRSIDLKYKPVVIIDFDIHHGNGTQEIFWNDPDVIHIDIHDSSIYPFTGHITDLGGSNAEGSKINIPLPPGSRDKEYLYILLKIVLPLIETIKPKILLASAGFDAHEDEDMGYIKISSKLYRFLGYMITSTLNSKDLNIVGAGIVLEGGYRGGLIYGFRSFLKGLSLGLYSYKDKPNYSSFSNLVEYKDLDNLDSSINYTAKEMTERLLKILNRYYSI